MITNVSNDLPSRRGMVSAIIHSIGEQPFVPKYRGRELRVDNPILGWPARLNSYFWPKLGHGYSENVASLQALLEEGAALAETIHERSWNGRALKWAHKVFTWGKVPQPDAQPEQVRLVFDAALRGIDNGAPMNSGWTKVAAFGTAHLEQENRSQVIWDIGQALS